MTTSDCANLGHHINGERVAGGGQPVLNPATGQAESAVLLADKAPVEAAIASAQTAFPAWRNTPPLKRAREMSTLKVLQMQHADELCEMITREHGKRVQAQGDAKNHAVVMPDAVVPHAVNARMGATFGFSGERCMARALVVAVGDETADAVISGLKTELAKMRVVSGLDAHSEMGPLVTQAHLEKVKGYVDQGVKEGATLLVDDRGVKLAGHEAGYFLGPCLFDHVKPGMTLYQEEISGPVLGVVRVKTLEQAPDLIDAHEYGNGTCIFTRDAQAARYFTDNTQVGMLGVNVPLPVPMAHHSFGGCKRSLFGDLHADGLDAVRFTPSARPSHSAGQRPVGAKARCLPSPPSADFLRHYTTSDFSTM